MSRRSRAREVVLQVLYQDDLNPPEDLAAAGDFLRKRLADDALVAFAQSLLSGVRARRRELDELLAKRAANWSIERMAATDRNVLRLGAFEILFTETPDRVAINEAVELAKRYGAKQSPQFVNGILDRFLNKPREVEAAPAVPMAVSAPVDLSPAERVEPAAKRIPSAADFAKALLAVAEKPGERKFPAYFRTLLKSHCQQGATTVAELAEIMGWEDAGVVLGRYEDLGKRLGEELHFDPPRYNAQGEPLWITVLAVAQNEIGLPETNRWELRGELTAALNELKWI